MRGFKKNPAFFSLDNVFFLLYIISIYTTVDGIYIMYVCMCVCVYMYVAKQIFPTDWHWPVA